MKSKVARVFQTYCHLLDKNVKKLIELFLRSKISKNLEYWGDTKLRIPSGKVWSKCLYNKITNDGFLVIILNKVQNVTLYILYTNSFGCSIIRGYFDTF